MRTKWMGCLIVTVVALMLGVPATGAAMPGAKGGAKGSAPQPPSAGVVEGKVEEKLEGGGYTYLLVAQSTGTKEKVWVAVPGGDVKVGDEVKVDAQALMGGFESKTLKRKFDKVYFGTLQGGAPPAASAAAATPPAPPAPSSSSGNYADAQLKGKVLEVQQVPSYTYLRLATKEGEKWAAVPTTEVAVGAEVGVHHPSEMGNFESKTLKRKFDRIYFGNSLSLASARK